MTNENLKKLILTALFAALACITTMIMKIVFSVLQLLIFIFFGARKHHKIKKATMNFHDHCCKKSMFPAGIEPTTSA